MRMTWKVVRIDGPTAPEELGPEPLGVIISSDEMLAKTQTLLFCPLIRREKAGVALAMLPWHVEVGVQKPGDSSPPEPWLLCTKIVLPTSLNEIDTDGLSRGELTASSRRAAADMLKKWLPLFPAAAR
jgi:hypothetical protein